MSVQTVTQKVTYLFLQKNTITFYSYINQIQRTRVISLVLQVGRHKVQKLHKHLEPDEASSVGGEGSQHDRSYALIQCQRAFVLHQLSEYIANAIPVGSFRGRLQSRFEHIGRHSDGPVGNTCHSSGKDRYEQSLSGVVLLALFWRESLLHVFVREEIHSRCRNVSKQGGKRSLVDTADSSLGVKLLRTVYHAVVFLGHVTALLNLQQALDPFSRGHHSCREHSRERSSGKQLKVTQFFVRSGLLQSLSHAKSEEAHGKDWRHASYRSGHSFVQPSEPLVADCLLGAVQSSGIHRALTSCREGHRL
ncbi:AAEL001388-PA [Aedes aegypti]|uniref:AAEL001388-PA n=1 Tax=Aedes aegypti TaxID=7159 RepID=Q17LE0_AEDAE|nr:AAEL001388-PA [Aedes aegypti]